MKVLPKETKQEEKKLEIQETASAVASDLLKMDKVEEQKKEETSEKENKPIIDKVILKLKDGKKDEWKKFFGSKGKNLSEGIRMAVDYLIQEEASGNIIISDCGIRKNEFNDLLKK